jgi:7,8-dihydroneopterin aldolase/epimerase/oxygenase
MGIIKVSGIKLYAYHGCLEEEAVIGSDYVVDVVLSTDFNEASLKDDLSLTIDYVNVYEIVKAEMAIRSKLIENVGKRIFDRLNSEFKNLESIEVTVTKINPPVNGNVGSVSAVIKN